MKRFFAVLLLVFSLLLVLVSCGNKSRYDENYVYDGNSLVGTWREGDFDDEFYQIYSFYEDKITLTSYSYGIMMQEIEASYTVEGNNTLVISWGDGYVDRNNFSITRDSVLVITQVLSSSVDEMELLPYDLKWNTKNSDIVGTWTSDENPAETFTFREDYTLVVEGELDSYSMPYAIKDNTLALGGEFIGGFKEEVTVLSYKVQGDSLTLTGVNEDKESIIISFTRSK